jgi:hypothetical protein
MQDAQLLLAVNHSSIFYLSSCREPWASLKLLFLESPKGDIILSLILLRGNTACVA